MSEDWVLWAFNGLLMGTIYAYGVVRLNSHRRYGKYWRRLVWLEVAVGAGLAAGTVCGLTGLWWLLRPIGLAYLMVGGPAAVMVIIATIKAEANEDEHEQTDQITGNTAGTVRDPGLFGGDGGSLCQPGGATDPAAYTPGWVERNAGDLADPTGKGAGRN